MAKTPEPTTRIPTPAEHERTREALANLARLQQRLSAIRQELSSKCGEEVNVSAATRRQREIEAAITGKPLPADAAVADNRPQLQHEQTVTVEAIARQKRVVADLVHAASREICEPLRSEYTIRVKRIVAAMAELRQATVAEMELRESVTAAGWSWTLPICNVKPTIAGYQRLTEEFYLGRYLSDAVHAGVISAAEAKAAGLEPL